ncbi:MAG TPA: DUF6412 domain-containing protein [Pseudolysinimonas sp.]|nr:DUF6412 domain-containing protein [Pseudolysinimonas sp.]
MRSAVLGGGRPFAALVVLLGAAAAAVLPAPPGAIAAGLVAAVFAILVASAVGSARLAPIGLRVGTRTRAVLQRLDPRVAQSDPDARGHARPRAPAVLLTAV